MTCREAERLLNPYLDGELDVTSSLSVESHIEECERCGRQYRLLEQLRDEIANAGLHFETPVSLERRIGAVRAGGSPHWREGWRRTLPLAAAAGLLVLAAIPWLLMKRGSDVETAVLDSHLRSLAEGHLVDVPSSDRHTVKPWFQGRTSVSPPVPDLGANGFELAGGRLDVLDQTRTAAIVYRRRQHVINIFVTPVNESDRNPHASARGGYNLVAWTRGGLRYWAVSDLNAAELSKFVELFRGG